MKPHKKSIRDFFSPVPTNSTSAAASQSTLPQRNAKHAPTRQSNPPKSSAALPDAVSHVTHPPLSSSNPSVSTAPSTTRAASADAPPFNPSQTSANSGTSRRIESNGQQMVLNSDSDDDSLPDLDFGIPVTKVKALTTMTTTRSKRTSEDQVDGLRKPVKKAKGDRINFSALVQTAQKNRETERQILEHKTALETPLEIPVNASITINEETLGQVVDDDDDPEKAHRLFQAMQRTNATQLESTFHFFKDNSDSNSIPMRAAFPIRSLPNHRWVSNFEDSYARDQAFMTGFAQQIFHLQKLPPELASWMIDQISSSRNEALNYRYIEILESEKHNKHLYTLLDSTRLETLFREIGADMAQLEASTELTPVFVPRSETRVSLPLPLISIAKLLERAAPCLQSETRSRALYILSHVCLDDRVMADAAILHTIQDAMGAIVCSFANNHKLASALSDVVSQLLAKVTHPLLQRNLIRSFPTTSPLTAYLQRHLALAFLVHPTPVDVPLSDPKVSDIIYKHMKNSPSFQVNKNTNYSHLAARLALLDIAIGPGLLDVPYQPLSSPTTSEAGSSPVSAPVPASSEVRDFNNQVDALAREFQLLGNSIVEAGAVVDLTIMDTKDSIERLRARLEHAVRIGGKKAHNVFGNDDEDTQLKVSKFFTKRMQNCTPAPLRGIFDGEDDVLSDVADSTNT
ncbi:hypothetical protein J4E82_004587 [Alternaria postmessia]|uniref:uncharacterized protein n=1 Tax=Alternaria postmessia TaxID=1187938 RepID=UPI0010D584A7|nr:uncharacterized protein J4E82_004587 [Alternaria postmessia]KAI5376641.1 hypothetical protein J4E82_004587 [Alternaria postmessia]RYN75728.1 hypothetical protein AA0120_g11843 [Alternaria tenuissima]